MVVTNQFNDSLRFFSCLRYSETKVLVTIFLNFFSSKPENDKLLTKIKTPD